MRISRRAARRRDPQYIIGMLILLVVVSLISRLQRPGGLSTRLPAPPPIAGEQAGEQQTARVARVIDGDTIVLDSGEHVRYIGVDTPEMRPRPEPFAKVAAAANARLVEGKTVRLAFDVDRRDRYDRLLAYVYVGRTFVNLELVEQGIARAKAYPPNTAHQRDFEQAQARARTAERGMWNWEGK